MAIRLKVQEDKVRLKVGQGEGATLNAVREARPILVNDYDDLINKPSINGVELEGNLTTEDLHIQAGVTSWNGQTGDVVYTPPEVPVQSVNGKVGAVVLTADDVNALPDSTVIPTKTSDLVNDSGYVTESQLPDENDLVHKAGAETITGNKTFTNAIEVSRSTSGAILKLSSSAADTNFILERINGSQCVLESGGALGLFGTKTNHPLQVRTNYVNRMTIGTDGSVVLATNPAASSNNGQVATTKWVNDKGYAQASDIPTKTSDLTNDSGYITGITSSDVTSALGFTPYNATNPSGYVNATQAASAAPVQSVNGQTGSVVIDDEVFIAEYGVTTYADVLAAYNAGAIIFAKQNNELYALGNYTAGTQFNFYLTKLNYANRIGVSSSGWNAGTVELVPSTRKVNNKSLISDITLAASDVGALPDTTVIPTKTSDLTNDSGFVNASGAANAAPVQSVNSATGAVVLGATDVGALPDTTNYAGSPSVGGSATFANGIHYGRVDGTSTSTAFTATIPGITSYYDGLTVILYNGKVTSASGYTININGLGAYGTYNNMTLGNEHTPTAPTRDTTIFNINYAMIFTYCSDIGGQGITGWICYRGYDANTNTIGYQIRTNSYSLPMTKKVYRYRLLFTSADGEGFVPANTSTSTNATSARTVCQDPIDPFGPIVYYGTTSAVDVGSRPSVSNLWQEYAFNLGYSFQKSPNYSLTSWKPVYLKCAPQTNGSAIIDSTDPIVQALPSAADGNIYIFLGVAYSTTNIELNLNHSVYYIDANARKRIWTGEDISI